MKLDIEEKKVMYAFGCSNYGNTVTRLKWLTSFAVEPGVKHRMLGLVKKLEEKGTGEWYCWFYDRVHLEMERYFRAERDLMIVIENTEWEDMEDEAV